MSDRRCVLVTGSSGLVGSEAVRFYSQTADEVHGIDNNMRRQFFGEDGDTSGTLRDLQNTSTAFRHHHADVRDRDSMADIFQQYPFDLVIHCAAQPSHDLAGTMPWEDFHINAVGTLNLLEATRRYRPDATFVFLSTNKVYGEVPNGYSLRELDTRWEFVDSTWGIDERCRIDQCMHSLFGASKLAADIMVQEYGRYYRMKTGIFRAGCLTGPQHASVKLHGFLRYLVKMAVQDREYTIIGHKGKQVRDQLHCADMVAACDAFAADPRPGKVYNIGGGYSNSASVIECIAIIADQLGRPIKTRYVDEHRKGDHICYYSDTRKFRKHYPKWTVTRSLSDIIKEQIKHEQRT